MLLNVFRQVITCCRYPLLNKTVRFYGLYTPPYIQEQNTSTLYPVLNIQITGYTYSVLESYQSYIHKIAHALKIHVIDGFPFPHREFNIRRFKVGSTIVDSEYNLKIYERYIQVEQVTSTNCPIFIRILEATLPEGVSLCIQKYDHILQKKRYIPDKELLELKSQLEELKNNQE